MSDFRVKKNGAFVIDRDTQSANRSESGAWKVFLSECRGGGDVELWRGDKPVAWLQPPSRNIATA